MVSWLFDLRDVIPGEVSEGVGIGVGPLRQEQLDVWEVPGRKANEPKKKSINCTATVHLRTHDVRG